MRACVVCVREGSWVCWTLQESLTMIRCVQWEVKSEIARAGARAAHAPGRGRRYNYGKNTRTPTTVTQSSLAPWESSGPPLLWSLIFQLVREGWVPRSLLPLVTGESRTGLVSDLRQKQVQLGIIIAEVRIEFWGWNYFFTIDFDVLIVNLAFFFLFYLFSPYHPVLRLD